MKNTSRLVVSLATLALGLSVQSAVAASLNSHYETDLENYRACKVDSNGDRYYTCSGNDVRSASKFHLADGTQGSISVTSAGVVKARIDGLSYDANVSFACPNYQCDLAPGPHQYRCLTGPMAPNTPCITNAQCGGDICVGGPKDGQACDHNNPDAACKSLVSVPGIASVVFAGNMPTIGYPGGYPAFQLNGDNGDPGNGCTRICTLDTNNLGKINSDNLSCTTVPSGCLLVEGFHSVQVVDSDGKIIAVPDVGTAHILPTFVGINDPAKYGDVCRNSGSPPADCAFDQ